MPGLMLKTGGYVTARGGGYSPLTPASAQSPSGSGSTIGQMAYGVSGSGVPDVRATPGFGAVGAGIVAILLLGYIYWTLPR